MFTWLWSFVMECLSIIISKNYQTNACQRTNVGLFSSNLFAVLDRCTLKVMRTEISNLKTYSTILIQTKSKSSTLDSHFELKKTNGSMRIVEHLITWIRILQKKFHICLKLQTFGPLVSFFISS